MTHRVENRPQTLLRLASNSQSAPLAQLFIMDALMKQGMDIPGFQPGDTTLSVLTDLLEGDPVGVCQAVEMRARGVVEQGQEAVAAAFSGNGVFDGRAWFGVAAEVHAALEKAQLFRRFFCPKCSGQDCGYDANAVWDEAAQAWVLGSTYDKGWCNHCGDVSPVACEISPEEHADALKTAGGTIEHPAMIALRDLVEAVRKYDASLNDEDQPGGAVAPAGCDYNELFAMVRRAGRRAGLSLAATAEAA